ncbi:hemicentin-1 isoform X1 [Carassius gibelio]|uniref:hemicentin-1 isoform X1 n=1 Tax=Carassius gibelio TaxID=101364 RepID=UPI00227898F7|nr:hemicentin-1 isoform X1 [Carassius gibelio]
MDFLMTEPVYKLLIFLCMIQGMNGGLIHYKISATAVEGQNISLQCIVTDEHDITIIQLEWIKQQKDKKMTDQKIVVFHPGFPIHYFQSGFLLETVTSSKTRKLQGSILTLREVRVKDTGNYICEITSYPTGSIKRITKLQFTEPPASVKMSYPYGFIKEGDDMKITCSAIPPPIHYKLKRSKNKIFWLESSNGEFTLPHVTRNDSDVYICLPEWDSLVPNLQGLNATVEVTVNFLDGIECNTSSSLNVSAGEDVVISCIAKASQYLQYKWMRGDTTLSLSDTLSLTSMTSEQSGTYKLTAVFLDNQLQTDIEISIQVLPKQNEGMNGGLIHYKISATAVEGQNISLQCIVTDEHDITIIQLEWIKQQKDKEMTDQKIVVFHPGFPIHYFQSGFLLETVTSSKTRKLQGSILTLREVRVKDTGNYICEITSYPTGSIKRITKLQVTEPPASVKMSYPYGFIKEGDDMKITCSAIPPPIHYKLKRSKNKIFWLESSNGEFTLPHVTRNDSDVYICLPEWDSLVPNLQGLNATVEVTVN